MQWPRNLLFVGRNRKKAPNNVVKTIFSFYLQTEIYWDETSNSSVCHTHPKHPAYLLLFPANRKGFLLCTPASREKMSNGIPYHQDSLTCAHRTLPFGTILEVRNLKNNKKVVVKVTDRGPHLKSRIIDLSYAAAKELGIVGEGSAQVEIKEWEFNPFYVPILIPFNSYGLFIPAKPLPRYWII